MKIEKIIIENYKSIKHVSFLPNKGLNAFIGGNSVGKSNIFDAINWLLGPVYPTFNNTKKDDHYLGNLDSKIRVRLEFDNSHCLELNEHREITNSYGQTEIKSGLFFDDQNWNCKGEIREQYAAAYLGVDRKITDYLPSNRWSLMGRILQQINSQFLTEMMNENGEEKAKTEILKARLQKVRDDLLFSVKDDSGQEIMKKFIKVLQKESANQLNKPESHFKVDLTLYDPWNFYRTLQLIVKEAETDLEFQASSLGMGIQASISIAILKAYSVLNLKNKSPIFIDEPELFLHPNAQRNFYKILRDLSQNEFDGNGELIKEGTQVFYTTHSPDFLSAGHFNEIFVIRKTREKGTYCSFASVENFIKDLQIRTGVQSSKEDFLLHFQNAYDNTGDSQKANEAFFAKKIILVEGQSESLALPYLFSLKNFDYNKNGITIVRCGSKNELDRFYRLYTEFGIPCFVIFDGDNHIENGGNMNEIGKNKELNKNLLKLLGTAALSDYPDNSVHNNYLGFLDEFEKNLGFSTSKKGLELFLTIKEQIRDSSSVPEWVGPLIENINVLNEGNINSALITREEGGTMQTIVTTHRIDIPSINYESEIRPEDLPF